MHVCIDIERENGVFKFFFFVMFLRADEVFLKKKMKKK